MSFSQMRLFAVMCVNENSCGKWVQRRQRRYIASGTISLVPKRIWMKKKKKLQMKIITVIIIITIKNGKNSECEPLNINKKSLSFPYIIPSKSHNSHKFTLWNRCCAHIIISLFACYTFTSTIRARIHTQTVTISSNRCGVASTNARTLCAPKEYKTESQNGFIELKRTFIRWRAQEHTLKWSRTAATAAAATTPSCVQCSMYSIDRLTMDGIRFECRTNERNVYMY